MQPKFAHRFCTVHNIWLQCEIELPSIDTICYFCQKMIFCINDCYNTIYESVEVHAYVYTERFFCIIINHEYLYHYGLKIWLLNFDYLDMLAVNSLLHTVRNMFPIDQNQNYQYKQK